jgi:hypothetical protein
VVFFFGEDKEEMKKKILANYCKAKPGSKLAGLVKTLGIEVAIKLVDEFQGEVLSIPTRNALQRVALPMIIRNDLDEIPPKSKPFKMKVKNLSEFYKLSKRAIIEMNKTGLYTR